MSEPQLTIGIPTQGKRPERLQTAIGSALGQSVPVRIVVSMQEPGSAELIGPYIEHPLVDFHYSPAPCLWDNWLHAARQCETDYFAWLQDDDILAPHFAKRVASCFQVGRDAAVYIARLGISVVGGLANWWQATGPMIPMDLLRGTPSRMASPLIQAGGYFTSWALSPAVAFRSSKAALEAIDRVPRNADLYAERLVLAELATLGPAVCDPAIVGYWVHHETNESASQSSNGGAESQYPTLLGHLDAILEDRTDWQEPLRGWALMGGSEPIRAWLRETRPHARVSPSLDRARAILAEVLGEEADPEVGEAPELAIDTRRNHAEKAVTR